MKHTLLLTVLLLLCMPSRAQKKFEIGKVSLEELQEKTHPKDSAAEAAVLFRKGEVSFDYLDDRGFVMTTKVKTRIKIYKKKGYDWANFQQRYYVENNSAKETVSVSDAATYNLENGKIVKTKLKSDGEFDEKTNKYWNLKKITMPNVKEGSVIEYSYEITSPNIGSLDDWDFQSTIPVNFSEFTTNFPEYYVYRSNQRGYIFPKVATEKLPRSFYIQSKERSGGVGFSAMKTSFNNDKIDYELTRTTHTAQDLPAMRDEAYVNNIHNYMSSISHELSVIRFPNKPIKSLSTDWVSVVKNIYDNDDFGAELNKTGYFDQDVTALLAGVNVPEQKIMILLNFVKQNVKWNNFYGISCNDGVRQAYKNKTGNVAEINLMLTAMLRYAGFDANPVLVSTRSNGVAFFPSRAAFNYVIASVQYNGQTILLDATEKHSLPNILPIRDLNWLGRLIRKDGTSEEIDLMPATMSKETVTAMLKLDASGEITGKVRNQMTDYNAMAFRQSRGSMKLENYLEWLENENHKIEVSDYKRDNEDQLLQPVTETYAVKSNNDVEKIGDKMYIVPLLFMNTNNNPFKQEVREYPVDFSYPLEKKYTVSLEIPDGYTVETLPANLSMNTEGKFGTFKYVIAKTDNKIQALVSMGIQAAIVGPEDYPALKDFFQKVIDKQNEKIVLKKI